VVGGGSGEVWPFGPGPSPPIGARGGVVSSGWWWVRGGLAPRPRPLSPVGGEGWILWLVVCPGRFGPLAPALLALRGRGVEVCDQKNWEES